MSDETYEGPAYNMNKYRKALRAMWKGMQRDYVSVDSNFVRASDGTIRFVKAPFPQIEDFEIKQQRRGERLI